MPKHNMIHTTLHVYVSESTIICDYFSINELMWENDIDHGKMVHIYQRKNLEIENNTK